MNKDPFFWQDIPNIEWFHTLQQKTTKIMHIVIHNPIGETAIELEVGESVLIDMNILTKANNMVVGTSIRPAFLGRIMKLI